MYKAKDNSDPSFLDFNQPLGLHMNPDNRWVRLAQLIPWDEYEARYASHFTSTLGNVAKPCRMALGALIIQKKLGFSDRELVEEITETPYLQSFIGLPGYQEVPPFDATTLVSFRKRFNVDMSIFMNEKLLEQRKAKAEERKRRRTKRRTPTTRTILPAAPVLPKRINPIFLPTPRTGKRTAPKQKKSQTMREP